MVLLAIEQVMNPSSIPFAGSTFSNNLTTSFGVGIEIVSRHLMPKFADITHKSFRLGFLGVMHTAKDLALFQLSNSNGIAWCQRPNRRYRHRLSRLVNVIDF